MYAKLISVRRRRCSRKEEKCCFRQCHFFTIFSWKLPENNGELKRIYCKIYTLTPVLQNFRRDPLNEAICQIWLP